MILLILCLFFMSLHSYSAKYELKQVVILSRHNLRTPVSNILSSTTPETWPEWNEKNGYLTEKGALLEGYMGEYFSAWLRKLKLLPKGCPENDVLYVYANYKQRTKASAKAFINKGFPGCNVTINSRNSVDPVFNPIIHNRTEAFKEIAYEEMKEKLKDVNLTSSYNDLEDVLDFRDSEICKLNHRCDLNKEKNNIFIKAGEKPNILGPMKIGNSVVDAFLMEYFEGFSQKDIAWGKLVTAKQWESIINIQAHYLNTIFNTTYVAKDISRPLLRYMTDIFLNDYEVPKVTLLMGHDANIYPLINTMGFKAHYFADQYEQTPIGGKIVFQKWADVETKEEFLKVNYVYQSSLQLRDSEKLSLKNPPQIALMELKNCKVSNEGFCLWKDFENVLRNL